MADSPSNIALGGATGVAPSNLPHRTADMLVPRNSDIYSKMDVGNQAMLNAASSGQHGYAANNYRYVQEEPYVSERPYCAVLSTPQAFSSIPGAENFHAVLRNCMEARSRSWSGVSARTSIEYVDVTWQGGQTLSAPSGGTRQFGSITHELLDLRGEEISRMIDVWQEYILHDPVIRHPKIITIPGYTGDLLLDERSMSCIYFEPDPTFREVRRACLVLAMMIKEGPQYEMAYSVDDTAGKTREISMEFTGLYEWNTYAAKTIARNVMQRMALYNPNGKSTPVGFGSVSATLDTVEGGIINIMEDESKAVEIPGYIA